MSEAKLQIDLIPLAEKDILAPFPLHNTGAICYLNSTLQLLASCTSVLATVREHRDYLTQTKTGSAVVAFIEAATRGECAPELPCASAKVLAALQQDLKSRKPHIVFGSGQQSASEALVHLLDMMEPAIDSHFGGDAKSPLTRLFKHSYRAVVTCHDCKAIISDKLDSNVQLEVFHLANEQDNADFSSGLLQYSSAVPGFRCKCGSATGGVRTYRMITVPEIIVCQYNLYGVRADQFVPLRLTFPAPGGRQHVFVRVATAHHYGSLAAGHYNAIVLRKTGVVLADDAAPAQPAPAGLQTKMRNVYLAAYHYVTTKNRDKAAPAAKHD